jgi:N-methylhydantoinase A
LEALEADAASYLRNEFERVDDGPLRFIRKVDLRYVGQFHPLTLTLPDSDRTFSPKLIARLFHAAHRERYGHNSPNAPIEATTLRVTAVRPVPKPSIAGGSSNGWAKVPATRRTVYIEEEGWLDCAVQQLAAMRLGQRIAGPAVIEDVSTTIILASHNRGQILEGGHLQIDVDQAGC